METLNAYLYDADALSHGLLNDRCRRSTKNSINMESGVSEFESMTSIALNTTYHLPQYYYVYKLLRVRIYFNKTFVHVFITYNKVKWYPLQSFASFDAFFFSYFRFFCCLHKFL